MKNYEKLAEISKNGSERQKKRRRSGKRFPKVQIGDPWGSPDRSEIAKNREKSEAEINDFFDVLPGMIFHQF